MVKSLSPVSMVLAAQHASSLCQTALEELPMSDSAGQGVVTRSTHITAAG